MFFQTVKGSGKVYTADERAKGDAEIKTLNDNIKSQSVSVIVMI